MPGAGELLQRIPESRTKTPVDGMAVGDERVVGVLVSRAQRRTMTAQSSTAYQCALGLAGPGREPSCCHGQPSRHVVARDLSA